MEMEKKQKVELIREMMQKVELMKQKVELIREMKQKVELIRGMKQKVELIREMKLGEKALQPLGMNQQWLMSLLLLLKLLLKLLLVEIQDEEQQNEPKVEVCEEHPRAVERGWQGERRQRLQQDPTTGRRQGLRAGGPNQMRSCPRTRKERPRREGRPTCREWEEGRRRIREGRGAEKVAGRRRGQRQRRAAAWRS